MACLGLLGAGSGLAALTLDAEGRTGVLAAAAVTGPIQIVAFAALARARIGTNEFLAAWMGGALVRLITVGVASWALVARAGLAKVPTVLSLAGFFFAMLLMEPLFLRKE
ncbi:MAG: hypothetical protein EXR95_10760 [Gemmatimonadetes bacterium]|nr:hypothetical protein [Gemmatimonadota bacterium]